ncbi:MAG: SCO family protein, partial [Candidatus Binatia bacterium]
MSGRSTLRRGATLAALSALLAAPLSAADTRPPELRGVGIEQRLNQQVPLDLPFRNEAGETVTLGSLMRGKPVILSLVYYQCPMLCTLTLNGLVSALRAMPFDVGQEFDVITVSFDGRETPALAAQKKATYLETYRRPGAAAGWHFLTGDQASIDRLAAAVGFTYTYMPERNEFAHAAGITVLTPAGVLA